MGEILTEVTSAVVSIHCLPSVCVLLIKSYAAYDSLNTAILPTEFCKKIRTSSGVIEKDKYGNYKRYCCIECKQVSQLAKMQAAYANRDMDIIAEKRKATVMARYGVTNVAQTDSVKDKLRITTAATADIRTAKTKQTNLKNHGVESTNSLQSVKDKKKAAFVEKYGVDHQLKIPEVAAVVSRKNSENSIERLAKASVTKLEIYGDGNYNNRNKYKETCLEKFGVENPSQNAEVHQKKIDTCMKNYGVQYPQQDPDIFRKQQQGRFTLEEYIFPSGNKIMIQGYEPIAMDMLLREGYNENDFSFSNIPVIDFIFDGTSRKYYPDFFIPEENLLIEVKSTWTYEQHKEKNLAKQRACLEQGYRFRFMIIDGKHQLK